MRYQVSVSLFEHGEYTDHPNQEFATSEAAYGFVARMEEQYEGMGYFEYRVYPIAECVCKQDVLCTGFTNTCDCGLEYNFAGQLLG